MAFSKGTRNVSTADKLKLRSLMRYYGSKAHPFTECVRDNIKRWGPDLAKKRCAVLKDLIYGTTSWRKSNQKGE